jgi:hypothetical protein
MDPRQAALWLVWWADEMLRAAQDLRRSLVGEARQQGLSWAAIGAALGTTRQAAQQRYGRTP